MYLWVHHMYSALVTILWSCLFADLFYLGSTLWPKRFRMLSRTFLWLPPWPACPPLTTSGFTFKAIMEIKITLVCTDFVSTEALDDENYIHRVFMFYTQCVLGLQLIPHHRALQFLRVSIWCGFNCILSSILNLFLHDRALWEIFTQGAEAYLCYGLIL